MEKIEQMITPVSSRTGKFLTGDSKKAKLLSIFAPIIDFFFKKYKSLLIPQKTAGFQT